LALKSASLSDKSSSASPDSLANRATRSAV
jgi:hypothetical protein